MKNLLTLMFAIIFIVSTQISCKNTNNTAEQKNIACWTAVEMISVEDIKNFGVDSRALANHVKARNKDNLIVQEGLHCYSDSVSVNDSIRYFFLRSEANAWLQMKGKNINTGKNIRSITLYYNVDTKTYQGRVPLKDEYDDFYEAMSCYFIA